MKKKKSGFASYHEALSLFGSLGSAMAANLLVGIAIGVGADKYFGTKPWCTLIFILLGALAGFKSIFGMMQGVNRKES